MKRRRLAALLGALALTLSLAATAVAATPGSKVTICHATDSNSNPYVNPNVNISSSGHLQGGHDTSHLKDQYGQHWSRRQMGRHHPAVHVPA